MSDLFRALVQVGRLKGLKRAGWLRRGLTDTESVADHSFRAAVLALAVAPALGVDPARLLALMVVHDLPEGDPAVGDITPFCGVDRAEKRDREHAAMARLCAGVPEGEALRNLWLEYDAGLTPEARAAHELDALEMALQAREYEDRDGVDLSEFRASARARIRHPLLLRLLDETDLPRARRARLHPPARERAGEAFPGGPMTILTSETRRPVTDEKDLTAAFEARRDAQFILVRDAGDWLSAVGEGFGPYVLEWFPAERTGRHLRAAEALKEKEVLTALLHFYRGGPDWQAPYTWHEHADERPPLPARLLERLRGLLTRGKTTGAGGAVGYDREPK